MPTSNLPAVLEIRSQPNRRPPPVHHLQKFGPGEQTGTLDPLGNLQHTAYHVVVGVQAPRCQCGYGFGRKMLNSRFTRQALRLCLKINMLQIMALTQNDLSSAPSNVH